NWVIEIWDRNGNRVATTSDPGEFLLGKLDPECLGRNAPYNQRAQDLNARVFCRLSNQGEYVFRAARLTEKASRQLLELLEIIFLGIPLIVLLAGGLGYVLARRALKPISDMTGAARQITAKRLSERLPVQNSQDELGQLALAFNESFAGLE